jgi:hypothetical protein
MSVGTASLALRASGSLTGSLLGTAATASYVTSSAIVGTVLSSSYAATASYVVTALTASYVTASNVVGTVASASNALTASYVLRSDSFGAAWDGQGGVVTTGNTVYKVIPYAGTITGWSIVAAGASPTTTIDVWYTGSGTALPTVANSITGSAAPALSTGNVVRSSTLTGWTTSFAAGGIFGFNINSVANATEIVFTLEVTR